MHLNDENRAPSTTIVDAPRSDEIVPVICSGRNDLAARALGRCQHAGGRPNRIDEKGNEERLGRRPHIEHVARRPILAHYEVARTEVCHRPASFGDYGDERGLSHDILRRRRSQSSDQRDQHKDGAE